MVTNKEYTNIRRVLDEIHDHPMLQGVSLEQAVRYTLRFISINGFPQLYQDKEEDVEIHGHRGVLPCDLISVVQVKDEHGIALRSMTDTFLPHEKWHEPCRDLVNNVNPPMPPHPPIHREGAFKTQGRLIYTSFPEGRVRIAYKAIAVDDDGYPLLLDNETYLDALEKYIKLRVFTIKFDRGKINANVLQNAQQEYAWAAGMLDTEMHIPSLSEMESISRMWNTMIPQVTRFDRTFRDLGDREYIRDHRGSRG